MSDANTATVRENEIPEVITGMRLEWTKGENAGKPFTIIQKALMFDVVYDGAGYSGDLPLRFLMRCFQNGEIKVLSTPSEPSSSSLQEQNRKYREALEAIKHELYRSAGPGEPALSGVDRQLAIDRIASDALSDVEKPVQPK